MTYDINDPTRRQAAFDTRVEAAKLAFDRPPVTHADNGDEFGLHTTSKNDQAQVPLYTQATNESCATASPSYIATFTKGLAHDATTGLVQHPADMELFRRALFSGSEEDIRAIPLGPRDRDTPLFSSAMANNSPVNLRAWESMAAGLAFDLEGPDAQAVTMPPAPSFKSDELALEMTEVYWMALLRDTPFAAYDSDCDVAAAVESLNQLPWTCDPESTTDDCVALARIRKPFTPAMLFRGVLPGDSVGPYISQFLFAGNAGLAGGNAPVDGRVQYGAIRIDQRVRAPTPARDYMTTWGAWLDVQDGADVRGRESYVEPACDGAFRFIATPRDLACYVHYDALYEAYLNACLMLLSLGVPFDAGLPFGDPDAVDKQTPFATFGGPHILSLVTEVATRALKAVRFQKFNVHRRARPEVMAARIDAFRRGDDCVRAALADAGPLCDKVDDEVLRRVFDHNAAQNASQTDRDAPRAADADPHNASGCSDSGTYLLPMAFAEGSPMHPAYGAGHATVAGACTTVLKAFFDTSATFATAYAPRADGSGLDALCDADAPTLTVGGELNKVCSNVSIGRNFAGVHYYSDYIESVRMGEQIAIGILEEQMLTFGERFSMTLEKFDGSTITICRPQENGQTQQKVW